MTVDGTTIKCDAYACRNESTFDSASAVAPEYVRARFGLLGWKLGGDQGALDFCPLHD